MTEESAATIKQKVDTALAGLPPEGIAELNRYLDLLADKYHTGKPSEPAVLGGKWADLPFDVDDEEVRALRRSITDKLRNQD